MPTPRVLICGLVPVLALTLLIGAAPDAEPAGGRYQLTPAEGGAFLRLDRETGAMSVCQRKDGRWTCEALADDRTALEAEVARLAAENKELQSAVKRLEELIGLPDAEGKGRGALGSRPSLRLPSEQDVDRAMDYVQRMIRKFRERMRDFRDNDRRSL